MKTISSLIFLMISLSIFGQENLIDAPIITMTMEKPDFVDIYLQGSGKITIHWGDGKSNRYIIDNEDISGYTHTYSKSSEYTITITGDSITGLRCHVMQLTSLDVSQNTNLTHLDCSYSQLTSLDLSRNTNLTHLDCIDNNLTSLDLNKNTKLTDLCCNFNQLTSLDVSNSIALTSLSCNNNQISYLDVSRNTALEFLSCHQNLLTNLDISKNIVLTSLYCSNNQLQADALDELFGMLPNKVDIGASIVVRSNPGEFHCDRSIATGKGWKVFFNDFLVLEENMTFLKNWKSYPVPALDEVENNYSEYNHSPNNWIVYFDGDEIRVDGVRNYRGENPREKLPFEIKQSNSRWLNISAPLAGLIDVVEVADGYIVGFNRGEWGGELYWFSKNGKKRYKISGHQIVQFIERDNKIYAIEGLAHLVTRGSIIEIDKKGKKWKAKGFLKLSTAPEAIQLDSKGNFIVVTFGTNWSFDERGFVVINATPGLFSIDREANVDTLVENGIWGDSLYPSSMVIQNDVVYIGMRKGVYKFDLTTKRDEWLLPE
jgi:hypothetical protein